MKKHSIVLLTLVLLIPAFLISVAGGQPKPKAMNLTFVHGTTGGSIWALLAEGISESIRKTAPGYVVTTVPGSSKGNLIRLGKGEADLGYTFLNDLKNAVEGREGMQKTDLKVIASTHSTVVQWLALQSKGVNFLRDIKEKKMGLRLSVHQRGSGNEDYNKRLLVEYGIKYADIESWGGKIVHSGEQESCELMADGQIDAFGAGGAPPNTLFIDLHKKRKINLVTMDKEVIQRIANLYGYVPTVMKANTYEFQKEDYQTFSASVVLAVRGDMPDETAYWITKSVYDNRNYLGTVHSSAKTHMITNPEGIIEGIPGLVPVHPGALRFYKEAGLIK